MNEKTLPPLIISKKNSDIPSTSTYVHKTINNPPPLLYPNAQYSTTMAPKETISNIENQPMSGITAEELNAKLISCWAVIKLKMQKLTKHIGRIQWSLVEELESLEKQLANSENKKHYVRIFNDLKKIILFNNNCFSLQIAFLRRLSQDEANIKTIFKKNLEDNCLFDFNFDGTQNKKGINYLKNWLDAIKTAWGRFEIDMKQHFGIVSKANKLRVNRRNCDARKNQIKS